MSNDLPNRQSIRLKGYDYSQNGYYFVTLCVQYMGHIFGEIKDRQMILNDVGTMIDFWWNKLPTKFTNIKLGTYQLMPNHLHSLIIVGVDPCVDPNPMFEQNPEPRSNRGGRTHGCAPTLGNVIQWFKTMTTNAYIDGVKNNHWPVFPHHLWQRNFYERIIRNEKEYFAAREYIKNNPINWENDKENPSIM